MLASSIPAKFPTYWSSAASSTYVRAIPQTTSSPGAASFTQGFPASTFTPLASGGQPPDGRDMNGILGEVTQWQQFQQAGKALYSYDSSFQSTIGGYPAGAIVASNTTNYKYWLSTVDNNTTNPDTGGAGWLNFPQILPNTGVGAGNYTLMNATVGTDGRITAASSSTSINIAGSIISGTELYAPVIATTGSGYISIGTGTSTFAGQVNFAGIITAVSGVFSGVVTATTGGELGGVTLASSAITAGNGANFASGTVTCGNLNSSGTVTCGNLNSSGTLTAVDVTVTNQLYTENTLIALGAATLEGGCTVYGSLTLYTAGTGSGAWECQVPSGGTTVALESNIGITGGATTYTTGTGYLYGGSGPVSGNNSTGSYGLITTVGAVASGFHTTSDARLKDDVTVVSSEDGLRFIKKVNPYTWNWNDKPETEEKRGSGYVSQQLIVAGYPQLVTSFPVKELAAATHTFGGEEISSNANFKLIAKYDDTLAYHHAALRGALDLISDLKQKLDDAMLRIDRLELAA